ncbi:MAG: glutamate--tRNA ligase [Bacteroidales bacterium]|jgi:glutamyl-tRNA synthetase|nr:glutamate--tRNA ligase [Bacteroidales bacterium]
MERKVRVRFAPSPTGPLHIGGVRTALYNYLFAKKNGGDFILRIEDTDQGRFVPGAEEYIIETFKWLNLNFDEGVQKGGDYGPYRQSDRKEIYKEYAQRLIDSKNAYYAFDTNEELDAMRKQYESEKKTFQYDSSTRESLKNSITLPQDEVKRLLKENTPYVIRFLFPKDTTIEIDDLIRGKVKMNSNLLDDKVLFKSDGMPTYHLANVVDDHLMNITHVIRGEEWLPSTALHIMLYKAFDWEETKPEFAHLPLLLKPDGNGKLSKRDGDRLGFPVFPLIWVDPKTNEVSSGYRESGYLPEAVINMLALLGWNPGLDRDIFSLEELISLFSLDRISLSGAKFDLEKAKWFNHQYLQQRPNRVLAEDFSVILKEKGIDFDINYVEKVVYLVKERCSFVNELWEQSSFFFIAPNSYDEKVIKKRWKPSTNDDLYVLAERLNILDNFESNTLNETIHNFIEEREINLGQFMNCLRLSLVGKAMGPDLFEIAHLLGKKETIERIERAVKTISII